MTTRNPYFAAVEDTRTEGDAIDNFGFLLTEARKAEPYKDLDALRESVVASLMYVAGYYDEGTRQRTAELYAKMSPYRR